MKYKTYYDIKKLEVQYEAMCALKNITKNVIFPHTDNLHKDLLPDNFILSQVKPIVKKPLVNVYTEELFFIEAELKKNDFKFIF